MRIIRCQHCDALSEQQVKIKHGLSASCPCCEQKISKPDCLSLPGELALAVAALLFFIPAQHFSLISINLLGVELHTTVSSGAFDLITSFPIVAMLVMFCAVIAPLSYILAVFLAHIALRRHSHKLLFIATAALKNLRTWVMIDVFLVSLAVASLKVDDYTEIVPEPGLICFVLLQLSMTILLSRVSAERYWDEFTPVSRVDQDLTHVPLTATMGCSMCNLTQHNKQQRCLRCHNPISPRKEHSLQRTWALLIPAIVCIFPANLYSISILLSNGKQFEDTILSGVAMLINSGMYGIAAVIFTASIAVPIAKIVGLTYILACIHLKYQHGFRFRTKVYQFVHGIGKWSVMDLCVIAIMVSLLERGNLLGFTPGQGATAFALTVIFTLLATENLDSRLIWDVADQQRLAKYHRQHIDETINNKITDVQASHER